MTPHTRLGFVVAVGLAPAVAGCPLPAAIGEDDPPSTTGGATVSVDDGDDDDGAPASATSSPDSEDDAGITTTASAHTDAGTETGTTSTEDTSADACVPPSEVACDGDENLLHALGLGCPGAPAAGSLQIEDVAAAGIAVATQYGSTWTPVDGERLVVMSTGQLVPGSVPGGLEESGIDANANPDDVPLPPPISTSPGSSGGAGGSPFEGCDGTGDCSDSLATWPGTTASDLAVLRFQVEVPPDVAGFRLDFALLSAEYPEFVFTGFADLLVVWVNGELFTGNACALDQLPCSPDMIVPMPAESGPGTVGGGAMGWRTLRVPATPGETLEVVVALLDGDDDLESTAAVLDRWRWDCGDCRDDLALPCGVNDQLAD